MSKKMTGIILAGGLSKRFGSPKAFAMHNGIPFYQYSIQALAPFCDKIIIVTRPELENRFHVDKQFVHIIHDTEQYIGQGPLAGIHAAMGKTNGEWYIVLPIDVPFVKSWVFEELKKSITQNKEAIVPLVNGKAQPLIAIYNYSIKGKIEKQLENEKRSLHNLLEKIKVEYIVFQDWEPFQNINKVEDLK
ncbi:molybdopterin-guanine dinucleotide biosynthesis protein A [Salirhabdus euzebyi]|uniref:Probable molybdenum cofactor guanylyltransferase n=1 Tax=Salirhabdus euzebyi TaxID=394506 RepID=A0A841Q6N8_9BACI|nr:molybdenum cofactor guanylyltransferase [Salirhabdus euzebyi]MBB6454045.1 molybdopterin-guanine dinucleotide biosynthesis protein A [Salirhabdus euzebyi]